MRVRACALVNVICVLYLDTAAGSVVVRVIVIVVAGTSRTGRIHIILRSKETFRNTLAFTSLAKKHCLERIRIHIVSVCNVSCMWTYALSTPCFD